MTKLNKEMMKNLSFPDFQVEKMEFSQKNKSLKIFVDGAWLDMEKGQELGKGVLFFDDWENLSIHAFNPTSEKWITIDIEEFEPLKDICEAKFNESTVQLFGFSKYLGLWIEWKIENAKMHAEFE